MVQEAEERRRRIEALRYDYSAVPKRRVERCNLCEHDEFEAVADTDRYGLGVTATACRRCALVFQNPMMTYDAVAEFYAEVYRPLVSAYHGRRIDAESVEEEQYPYAQALAERLEPYIAGQGYGTLLDMGGSTGVVAEVLAERFGLAGTVCDPSPEETAQARVRGLETTIGTAEGYDAGERRFDVVILCQTVDHLLDVSASLANLRGLLSPQGLFFMDIVDFRATYLRRSSVESAVKVDHPYYLTESTAEAFLARSGFSVLTKSYAADRIHVGYVCRARAPDKTALPSVEVVHRMLEEMRSVQGASPCE